MEDNESGEGGNKSTPDAPKIETGPQTPSKTGFTPGEQNAAFSEGKGFMEGVISAVGKKEAPKANIDASQTAEAIFKPAEQPTISANSGEIPTFSPEAPFGKPGILPKIEIKPGEIVGQYRGPTYELFKIQKAALNIRLLTEDDPVEKARLQVEYDQLERGLQELISLARQKGVLEGLDEIAKFVVEKQSVKKPLKPEENVIFTSELSDAKERQLLGSVYDMFKGIREDYYEQCLSSERRKLGIEEASEGEVEPINILTSFGTEQTIYVPKSVEGKRKRINDVLEDLESSGLPEGREGTQNERQRLVSTIIALATDSRYKNRHAREDDENYEVGSKLLTEYVARMTLHKAYLTYASSPSGQEGAKVLPQIHNASWQFFLRDPEFRKALQYMENHMYEQERIQKDGSKKTENGYINSNALEREAFRAQMIKDLAEGSEDQSSWLWRQRAAERMLELTLRLTAKDKLKIDEDKTRKSKESGEGVTYYKFISEDLNSASFTAKAIVNFARNIQGGVDSQNFKTELIGAQDEKTGKLLGIVDPDTGELLLDKQNRFRGIDNGGQDFLVTLVTNFLDVDSPDRLTGRQKQYLLDRLQGSAYFNDPETFGKNPKEMNRVKTLLMAAIEGKDASVTLGPNNQLSNLTQEGKFNSETKFGNSDPDKGKTVKGWYDELRAEIRNGWKYGAPGEIAGSNGEVIKIGSIDYSLLPNSGNVWQRVGRVPANEALPAGDFEDREWRTLGELPAEKLSYMFLHVDKPAEVNKAMTENANAYLRNPNEDSLQQMIDNFNFPSVDRWATKANLWYRFARFMKFNRFDRIGKPNYSEEHVIASAKEILGLTDPKKPEFVKFKDRKNIFRETLKILGYRMNDNVDPEDFLRSKQIGNGVINLMLGIILGLADWIRKQIAKFQ